MIRSILILFLTTFSLRSATHYVAKSGLDSNPGTIGSPWLTVQKASTTAVDGDAVLIQTGFYEENVTFSKTNVIFYGNGTNNVFIRRFHPQSVSKFCTVSNLTLGTATLSGSHAYWDSGVSNKVVHCLVNQNLKQGLPGIRLSGSFGHILSNHVTGVTRECAVQLNSGSASNLVESNHFRDMDNVDIFRMWGRGNIIRDNDVYNILNTGYDSIPYHGDFIQWFSIATNTVSTNHIVEFNRVRDSRIQLFHLNGANSGIPQSTNIGGTKIRYNVFSGLTLSGHIRSPGIEFYNNVVYRCATNTGQGAILHVLNETSSYGTGKDSRIYNNVFIGCGAGDAVTWGVVTAPAVGAITDYNFYSTLSYGSKSHNEPHSLTAQNPQFTDAANLDFTILDTSPLIQKGTTADASYTTDRAGNPQSSPWTIGNFVFVGDPGNPGSLSLTFDSFTAPENSTLQIPVIRQVGTSGAASVDYQTANLNAVAGVDYTGAAGTLNWAAGNSDTNYINLTILNNASTNRSFTVSLSGATGAAIGSPSNCTVTITGSVTPLMPTLSFAATNGLIVPPFVAASGYVTQSSQTLDPVDGGSLKFRVTIPSTDNYTLVINCDAPTTANDSLFVDFDNEPTSPAAIWDITPLTTVNEDKIVNWRGSSTPPASEFVPKMWSLSAGEHTLIIRGREAGVKIYSISIVPVPPSAVIVVGVSGPASTTYYRAGQIVPIIITSSDTMDITGSPRLFLNTSKYAVTPTGSGTTMLGLSYTVEDGDNTQQLDYAGIGSLELNGGTITHDGDSVDLTLPIPGEAGSLSSSADIIIDTIKPLTEIGEPSVQIARNTDVLFSVSCTDLNPLSLVLTDSDINVTTTGSVSYTKEIQENTTTISVVAFRNISGQGTFSFSINPGVSLDLAGNTSTATAQSSSVAVISGTPGSGTANVVRTVTGTIIIIPQ